MTDMDNNAWFDEASAALREVLGAGGAQQLEADWQLHGSAARPVVTVFGAYDAGKSTLLKRLLVEAGEPVPTWLTISARRETFEIGDVEAFGCTFRDTPGIAAGNNEHEAIARDALIVSDVILLVLPPQLLTGDRGAMLAILSGKLFSHAGMAMDGAVKTIIARLDEGSVDPTDDEEGYRDYLVSKRDEWRQLLLREQIIQPESNVFAVAADPYQNVGNDPAPLRTSYGDAYRRWDGIDQLIVALQALPQRLADLRDATRRRFYSLRVEMLKEGVREQSVDLALQREEASIRREGLVLRRDQLNALLGAARAALNGTVEETLLLAARAQLSVETFDAFLAPRMDAAISLWWDEQNAILKRLISEVATSEQVSQNRTRAANERPGTDRQQKRGQPEEPRLRVGKQVDSVLQKMRALLQEHHEGRLGMSFSKAREQLTKLDGAASFDEYLSLAGKGAKFGTAASAEKAKRILHLDGMLTFAPVVIELGGLIMDAFEHHGQEAERKRRREELRNALRKHATLMADTAWRTWSAPAKQFQEWLQKREEQAALEENAAGADIDVLEAGITRLSRIALA